MINHLTCSFPPCSRQHTQRQDPKRPQPLRPAPPPSLRAPHRCSAHTPPGRGAEASPAGLYLRATLHSPPPHDGCRGQLRHPAAPAAAAPPPPVPSRPLTRRRCRSPPRPRGSTPQQPPSSAFPGRLATAERLPRPPRLPPPPAERGRGIGGGRETAGRESSQLPFACPGCFPASLKPSPQSWAQPAGRCAAGPSCPQREHS